MLEIGKYNVLTVARQVDFGCYLSDGEGEILLPRKYEPEGLIVGDRIRVFVYCDSEDRPIATTLTPKAVIGDILLMQVKDVSEVGAFLDWGLEKDLFVPFREQRRRMAQGEQHVVRVYLDELTGRVLASSRMRPIFQPPAAELKINQEVEVIVYEKIDLGYLAVVDRRYSGMLYHNEIFQPVRLGSHLKGYISKIRDDDKIDVRLRKSGFKGIEEGKTPILDALREAGGFLPFNSQTPAETIAANFHMSKKVFKQRIGMLYKERLIVITDDGIALASPAREK